MWRWWWWVEWGELLFCRLEFMLLSPSLSEGPVDTQSRDVAEETQGGGLVRAGDSLQVILHKTSQRKKKKTANLINTCRSLVCTRSFIREESRTRLLITLNRGYTKPSPSLETNKKKCHENNLSVYLCFLLSTMMIWDSSSVLTFALSRNRGTEVQDQGRC